MSPVDAELALSYKVFIGFKPPKSLVSEIFSIAVADRQTEKPVVDLARAAAKL